LQFLRDQEKHLEGFTVKNISKNDNSDVDELAKAAAQNTSLPQDVFYQILKQASIKAVKATPREVHIIQSEDWRAPIMAYLRGHYEPENEVNNIRMKQRTKNYKIINNQLYKQGICAPLLKCISAEEEKKATIRNTRKNLQHTSWSKNNGKKSIPLGILLAISPK
jgi:hypothetical protein